MNRVSVQNRLPLGEKHRREVPSLGAAAPPYLSSREPREVTALSHCAASTRHSPSFSREHCKRGWNRALVLFCT